ncbi:MAG: AMP-binding protein [Methanosphaera sp.]|uniref:AMP-binding protein n=1 Tax=Methanosphaera sp. TaxID=2666342 RepID=UPI0025E725AF|nr:AMP-binding protein [Methanosphaera sp.]MCI5867565.1 AMP-binding protein [Methanosphaera sp.]MDD6534032.1 AMP-binding protein [Methanosphaera sp.]MDY3956158.1 AMP-binding protein [Methanosphaera sp.]
MTSLVNKYANRLEFESYEDFYENFEINVPENFNFAYDIVDEYAKIDPEKVALKWCDPNEEKTFTFADLKRMSDKAANFFTSIGVKRGDRVLLTLKSQYDFWYCIVALHKIKAIAIPATHMLKPEDIEYRIGHAGINTVVTIRGEGVPERYAQVEKDMGIEINKVYAGDEPMEGWYDLRSEVEKASEDFQRPDYENDSAEDISVLFFSSGSTGQPKMIEHSFGYPLAHIVTSYFWHQVVEDGLHYTIADTGWGKALWGEIYGSWICGSGIYIYDYERFHAFDVLSRALDHKITTLCCPPTMYRLFIKDGDLESLDYSSLQHVTTAGEPLNDEVYYKFKELTNLEIKEAYGQTETVATIANFPGIDVKLGSMGKPAPLFDIKLIDLDGNEVDVGQEGEIVIDISNGYPLGLFKGYYNNPEKTQEAINEGIYHTGDSAWIDEEGYYWYKGRVDDVIKSSGYKIGPFEVESALLSHDAVLDCAVTGIPDDIRGQIVKASIVLNKGYEPSDELTRDIQNHVKSVTAPYKYPRAVAYVDSLPKTISGKIMRKKIRLEDEEKLKK